MKEFYCISCCRFRPIVTLVQDTKHKYCSPCSDKIKLNKIKSIKGSARKVVYSETNITKLIKVVTYEYE